MNSEDVEALLSVNAKRIEKVRTRKMMSTAWQRLVVFFTLSLSLAITPAQAFMLGSTRAVLPEGEATQVLVISSDSDGLLLIRARVTDTVSGKVPLKGVAISPPLFRLDKGERATMRMQALALEGKPRDRESVLYLSVSGLPSSNPLSRDAQRVTGSMLVGTGIQEKVFYRPSSLSGIAAEPWKTMTVTRVPGGVKVSNPSPFHLTFSQISIDGHRVVMGGNQPTMIRPFGSQVYGTKSVAKKTLTWKALNDTGGDEKGESAVQ